MMIAKIAAVASLVMALNASLPAQSPQQSTPASVAAKTKEQSIRELLELTNSSQLGKKIAGQLIDQYRKGMPKVPESFWTEVAAETERDMGKLIDQLVPVYDRHFTLEEIRELINFYHTPVGQKLLKEQINVLQESFSIGETWGRGISARIRSQLEAKKYVK
jgi:hypothetical protein